MILVTGASGFLGMRLVRALAQRGATTIRCLVRPGTTADIARSVVLDFPQTRIDVLGVSFNDEDGIKKAFEGVDIVYHAAAAKRGSAPAMIANTVVSSENLYKAALNARVSRFVLVSSFGVMGVATLRRGSVVDESVPMEEHPEWRDAYSFSKHRQECLAWKYATASGLPLVVVRPGVIFGPGANILTTRIGMQLPGFYLHLGGSNQVPLTYVDNCADAVALAGLAHGIDGEVFCIVDDDLPTSRSLLHRYRREMERIRVLSIPYPLLQLLSRWNVWYSTRTMGHFPTLFTPYEVASIWKLHRFTNRKAMARLAWTPRVGMREALNATYASLTAGRLLRVHA